MLLLKAHGRGRFYHAGSSKPPRCFFDNLQKIQRHRTFEASFDLVIKHIEYIINLVGVDYVGIGSDFDGIELPPQQLDDVTTYPLITKALLEKGIVKRTSTKY
jgi:microsomal dipeptidase-like Zn-dependent dipeptidase